MLALPAPGDVTSLVTLNCAMGEPVVLDHFGPVVVNSDGTLSRITNWERMDEREVSTSLTLTLTPPPTPHAIPFFLISVLFQSGPISLQHTHDLRPPPTPTRVYGVYFDSVLT